MCYNIATNEATGGCRGGSGKPAERERRAQTVSRTVKKVRSQSRYCAEPNLKRKGAAGKAKQLFLQESEAASKRAALWAALPDRSEHTVLQTALSPGGERGGYVKVKPNAEVVRLCSFCTTLRKCYSVLSRRKKILSVARNAPIKTEGRKSENGAWQKRDRLSS